jgi:hypothetical protein
VLLGLAFAGYQRQLHRRLWAGARSVGAQLRCMLEPRPRPEPGEDGEPAGECPPPSGWSQRSTISQLGLLGASAVVAFVTLITLIRLVAALV